MRRKFNLFYFKISQMNDKPFRIIQYFHLDIFAFDISTAISEKCQKLFRNEVATCPEFWYSDSSFH